MLNKIGIALTGLLVATWVALEVLPPTHSFRVDRESIRPASGFAYTAPVPPAPLRWLFRIPGDTAATPDASKLRLFENGRELGPPHTPHTRIREKGGGSFSHWEGSIWFSSTDGRVPSLQSMEYEARGPLEPTRRVRLAALIAFALGAFLVGPLGRRRVRAYLGRALTAAIAPAAVLANPWGTAMICAGLILAAGSYLFAVWNDGRSVSLAIAGLYQISDAGAYWVCANSLVDFGRFEGGSAEWCQRRPIYSAMLASIIGLAGGYVQWALLIQAAVVAAALTSFYRVVNSIAGPVPAIFGLALMFTFGMLNAFPVTMSENVGLALGSLGFALMLFGAGREPLGFAFYAGLACVSLALNARAGAFFVLPAALIWVTWRWRASGWLLGRSLVSAIIAIAVGFSGQAFVSALAGGDPTSMHGNFSYTLYGLSVGGRTWSQVLTDHPELFQRFGASDAALSREIYRLALANIAADPAGFAAVLVANLLTAVPRLTGNDGPRSLLELSQVCWWVGWAAFLMRRREPQFLLLGCLSVGVVVSAPFLIQDGSTRVFAATLPIAAAQAAMGLWLIGVVLRRALFIGVANVPEAREQSLRFEWGLALTLACLIVGPFTALRALASWAIEPVARCSGTDATIVSRIGQGNLPLTVVPGDATPDFLRMRIGLLPLQAGAPVHEWYRADVESLGPGSLIRLPVTANPATDLRQTPALLIWTGDISVYWGRPVRICADASNTVRIFDTDYARITQITPLN